jgi:hypothetical protein
MVIYTRQGRAVAEAVSRRFATAARVRARVWSCGICGEQSSTGTGSLRVLRFPLPIFIPPFAPQSSSSIIWGWNNRPVAAAVPSGLRLTPLIIIIIIIIIHQRTTSPIIKILKNNCELCNGQNVGAKKCIQNFGIEMSSDNRIERLKGILRIKLR